MLARALYIFVFTYRGEGLAEATASFVLYLILCVALAVGRELPKREEHIAPARVQLVPHRAPLEEKWAVVG